MLAETEVSIEDVIENKFELYEDDLGYYYKIMHDEARNLENPYHNVRHMLHVTRLCYKACDYYQKFLTPRAMRNILIAAIFHDFDHTGYTRGDEVNIELAIKALDRYILPEDREYFDEIKKLIKFTEYPHEEKTDPSLEELILRDTDMSQGLSEAWIQQIMYGLSVEMEITPREMLKRQATFLDNLHFSTEWAKLEFPKSLIKKRKNETERQIRLLS